MKALAASLALFGLAFACRAQPFDPSLYPNASTGPTFDDKWTLRTPTELCAAARQAVGAPSALCRVERVRTSLPSEEQIPFLSERLVGKSVATVTVSDVVFDLGGEPPARTKPLTLDVRLLPETGEIISITSRWTAPASVWAPVTASVAEKQLIDGGSGGMAFSPILACPSQMS